MEKHTANKCFQAFHYKQHETEKAKYGNYNADGIITNGAWL